jgi:membrane-associated phospholipid phosphatase
VLKTNQRPRAFYYIILISFLVITNNLLKVVYKIPRPFWIFADVKAYACQKGFGSPSGHTMIAWAMPIAMVLDIRRSNPSGKVMIIISFVITLCIGLFEGWTRMVLGVHTIDQVMLGAVIGIWMAFTFEYIIKKPLIKHVMQINQNKLEELLPLKKLFLYSSLLSIGFLAFELMLYGIIFWPNWYFVSPLEYN